MNKETSAIILAAGMGSRFKTLTQNNHKALFEVGGTPNLLRTITYLKQAGIKKISVVTGYQAHLLRPLLEQENCLEYFNPHYAQYNNMYSLLCAQSSFGNSWLIDADVVLFENIFKPNAYSRATEMLIVRQNDSDEWLVEQDTDGEITHIYVGHEAKPSLLGISFWPNKEAQQLMEKLQQQPEDRLLDPKLYWCDIAKELIQTKQIQVFGKCLPPNIADELDQLDDLIRIQSFLS